MDPEYGYAEYLLHEKAAEMKHHFLKIVDIDEYRKQAAKAFRASEKYVFMKREVSGTTADMMIRQWKESQRTLQ